MAEVAADRLEPAAAVPELRGHEPPPAPMRGTRRRLPVPSPDEADLLLEDEEPQHQVDSLA
jgi:hypothetical protein